MKKYEFVKYNKNYLKLFEKEKFKLKKIIPSAKIEHIGSTSVEGLSGKGIIDILISVSKKDIEKAKKKLSNSHYSLSRTGGDKERIFFEKDYGVFKKRRVHIQLTYYNSRTYKEAIKFRNLLRTNLNIRKKYSLVKKRAISFGKKNKDYRKFKERFIEEALRGWK